MIFLKNKRAWNKWVLQTQCKNVRVIFEPKEYPCYVYMTPCHPIREQKCENYLYASDFEKMKRAIDGIAHPKRGSRTLEGSWNE